MTTEVGLIHKISSALLLFSVVLMARGQAPSTQDSANDLAVGVGKSVIIDCAHPVERVAVGLGGYAEAVAVSPLEILVNGKAPGQTSLIIWEKGGNREFFNVSVRAAAGSDRLESVRHVLNRELPGQEVKLTGENGTIFLSGTVSDLNSSDRAVQIASVAGRVVNLLRVAVPRPEKQVLLKVVFASVDRNKSKELGINIFSTGFGNVIGRVTTGQFSPPTLNPAGGAAGALSDELNLFAFLPGLNLGATLQALETNGLVQILSEPNLLAENGRQGSFLAGGEYPYPVVQGSGLGAAPTVTIQFKEYGVRLNFIPTIMPNGDIRLQVAPEVSALDFTNAVQVSGFNVPAISVRRVKTEIELSKGQSFAIGGLLDNRETETLQKVPFISNVPVLGKLFQSISKDRQNTELIVIVTPEIVDPTPAGTTIPTPKYPDQFLPPNSDTPMHTPVSIASGNEAPAPEAIPVEKLIDSMKPETPLIIDSGYSAGGGAGTFGGGGGGGGGGAASASVTPAPQ